MKIIQIVPREHYSEFSDQFIIEQEEENSIFTQCYDTYLKYIQAKPELNNLQHTLIYIYFCQNFMGNTFLCISYILII